eukprot:1136410-Pelagomonas_calceolata.AAC.4
MGDKGLPLHSELQLIYSLEERQPDRGTDPFRPRLQPPLHSAGRSTAPPHLPQLVSPSRVIKADHSKCVTADQPQHSPL